MQWDQQTYIRIGGDFASRPKPMCVKAQRKNLRRQVCVWLCDCGFYSWAVIRAEWISHIMLWMTCSELVAHKSTGGLSTRHLHSCGGSRCFSVITLLDCMSYFKKNQDYSCSYSTSHVLKRGAKNKNVDSSYHLAGLHVMDGGRFKFWIN